MNYVIFLMLKGIQIIIIAILYGAVISIEITPFTFKRSLLVNENSVIYLFSFMTMTLSQWGSK